MADSETKRVAWLSPFGPRSDIGAFTRNLLPHWASGTPGGFEAHLWVNENGPAYAADIPAFPLGTQANAPELLGLYDFTLFNVGNNQENHLDIFSCLKSNPGVVILHDYVYQHFFAWAVGCPDRVELLKNVDIFLSDHQIHFADPVVVFRFQQP